MTVTLLTASETDFPDTLADALSDGLCDDCGDALHDHDDTLCRWCEDNRARHPEDYELPAATRRAEPGHAVAG